MNLLPIRPRRRPSEEGYILVAVMFMLALLILTMAVAVPDIKKDIERDREVETMHRGKQFIHAIKLYYKKFGAFPTSEDALFKTNNMRFLRKKYVDPTTGKDEWRPIHMGQTKAPTALGFFGVPMMGSTLSGMANCGINGLNTSSLGSNGSPNYGFNNGTGPTSSFGSNSNSSFGSNSSSGFGSNSPIGGGAGCPTADTSSNSGDASGTSGNSNGSSSNPNDPNPANGNSNNASDNNGNSGNSSDSSGSSNSSNSNSSSGSSDSASNSAFGGQTFGGGGIIGFAPGSPRQSILVYKKKNHFNQWEFVYDPIVDRMQAIGAGMGPPTDTTGLSGAPGMSGNGFGGTGLGGNGMGGSGLGGSGLGGSTFGGSTFGGNSGSSSGSSPDSNSNGNGTDSGNNPQPPAPPQ